MKRSRIVLLWVFSLVFTLVIAVYQRMTGPTYPVSGKVEIAGQTIKYKLIRTHGGEDNARLVIKNVDYDIDGQVKYKRFGTNDEWTTEDMYREDKNLVADFPHQPPAGKIMYHVTLRHGAESVLLNNEPTIIRFKGAVPMWILIPHILIMFIAMMMSTRTGVEALAKGHHAYPYALVTLIALFVGGLILGPVVQKYAFGAWWTGWPFGEDLTDNKTLIAFIFWAIAAWILRKNPANRTWPVIAMVVLLMVYLIPHSMFGSSLDYSSGNVVTGK